MQLTQRQLAVNTQATCSQRAAGKLYVDHDAEMRHLALESQPQGGPSHGAEEWAMAALAQRVERQTHEDRQESAREGVSERLNTTSTLVDGVCTPEPLRPRPAADPSQKQLSPSHGASSAHFL